jgi:hypothetical protein
MSSDNGFYEADYFLGLLERLKEDDQNLHI